MLNLKIKSLKEDCWGRPISKLQTWDYRTKKSILKLGFILNPITTDILHWCIKKFWCIINDYIYG